MYRSLIIVALACVLALASAQRGCPKYCWYSEKIAKEKCSARGYPTKECMRNGVRGDTCDCSKGPGGPGRTPRPTKNPTPSHGPGVMPCGKFIMSKKPSPRGMSSTKTTVFIKRNRGFFVFDWSAYAIKDKFVINQGGDKIFDSDYVMGAGSNRVFLNGKGKNVMIDAMSQEGGSIWDFVAGCAQI